MLSRESSSPHPERPDECCGFGGTFSVFEEPVLAKMGQDKVADHSQAGAEYRTSDGPSRPYQGVLKVHRGEGPRRLPRQAALGSAELAGKAATLGGLTGLLPIGWIALNIIFLHRLADKSGACEVQEDSIANITQDRRLRQLLIVFSYGVFFEGAAGCGTPVAVTAAILIGLGFSPLAA